MELTKVNAQGLRHGLINTVGNSVPADDDFKKFAEKDRAECARLKKDDEKIVEAQYLHRDGKNERLERPYARWAGQPITSWRFLHGETYWVPKGLVKEVNDPSKCGMKRSGLLDKSGNALLTDEKDEPLHRFVPVGF